MAPMSVKCPPNVYAGQTITVQASDGRMYKVEVPDGVAPGQSFVIELPSTPVVMATPVDGTEEPTVVHVMHPRHSRSRYSSYYYDDNEACCGCGNACGLITLTLISFALSLSLAQHVSYYYSGEDSECYYDYRCCDYSYYCSSYCYYYVCDGQWRTTHPISQDKLPPPEMISDGSQEPGSGNSSSGPAYDGDGGDGTLDYWSIMVAVVCGSIASFTGLVAGCLPVAANGKNAPPKCMAGMFSFAGGLHITACICMAVQFFPKQNGAYVFNYFRAPQYEQLENESLMHYLLNDKYYSIFANCVLFTFIFCCITAIYEFSYMRCMFAIDERFTRPSRGSSASRGTSTPNYRL